MRRLIWAAALALLNSIGPTRAEFAASLPMPEVDAAGYLRFRGHPAIGQYRSGTWHVLGDGSDLTTLSPGATAAPRLADLLGQTFSVLAYRTEASVDGTNDDIAIQGAISAALARGGGTVLLPPRSGCYVLANPISINPGSAAASTFTLEGGGMGACIKPGRPMQSMIKAGGRWLNIRHIQLANEANHAINGIDLSCASDRGNTNNKVFIEYNSFIGFQNAIINTNCDA